MLFIVATPIGNLEDITLHALDVLKKCDYILCEDSRKSKILLNHYQITTRLVPFHKFNEKKLEERVLSDLQEGQTLALISDGGTPLISDPGFGLISKCIEKKVPYTIIPGPCSVIAALALSGLNTQRFQFLGFLPKKEKAIEKLLQESFIYDGTTIFFESPYRIVKTLKKIKALGASNSIVIARELTKKFEEVLHGKADDLLAIFEKKNPKGEFILLIEGRFCDVKFSEQKIILKQLQDLEF